MGEPGGLLSMGLHRVGHDWRNLAVAAAAAYGTGFPGSLADKESACNAGDPGSILGTGGSPEKGVATRSSVLAWKIPWTEEPGGLQSMWLQRVRRD